MYKLELDQRLSMWRSFRDSLKEDPDPLASINQFWSEIPTIPYNHRIERYNPNALPCPWEVIADNVYDDFTIALMIAYTIKLMPSFAETPIEIRTMVDSIHSRLYNLVIVEQSVLNFSSELVISEQNIPESFSLENTLYIPRPR